MKEILAGVIMFLGTILLIGIILGLPLMLLWDWLMPMLFGLPTITFLQAIGLNLLASILFKTTVKKN